MKQNIKKIIPIWLLKLYRKKNVNNFNNMTAKEVFTDIYNKNYWKSLESISGKGSEIKQTETLISNLGKLFKDMNITSVLDLPCGDFKWMAQVDLSAVNYTGADIVEELIKNNTLQHKERKNLTFKVINLITDNLPKSDIVIVRDCLVHLSYEDIHRAIKNIKSSGSKFLLTTTFTNHHRNYDIVTGDWRPVNLQEKPFNFSPPILVINENCSEGNGEFKDKSMSLWEIAKI